ncbi:hypothetical protein QYM36_011459 [Artemia franciscana]|uniref:Uncharacterized protein n=1 Tax=Artemia franciscana TaxID=6661 RepID=A0AA88L4Q3_ARTSF|nr:hypothetical protein QYM36_011459 [Artemia franciscana]
MNQTVLAGNLRVETGSGEKRKLSQHLCNSLLPNRKRQKPTDELCIDLFDSGLRSESIETRESVFTRAEQASSKTTVESRTSNCTSDSNCTILCHITPGFTIEKADEELDKPNKTPEDIEFEDTEPIEEFTQHFTKLLVHALVIGDKQPGVDRTLDYCVKFATCIEPGEPDDTSEEIEYTNVFFIGLLEFLIKHSYAPSQAVRFRVCQMIQKLLNELREDATLAEDLFTKIYDCMLERLRDRVAGIRVQAVFALQRLQEPSNKECPVIRGKSPELNI